jgi:hypothetical protein
MPRVVSAILPFVGGEPMHPDNCKPFKVGRQLRLSVLAQGDVGAAKPARDQTKLQHHVCPGHLDAPASYRTIIVRGCYEDGAAAFEQHALERLKGQGTGSEDLRPVDSLGVFTFQEMANLGSFLPALG